MSTRRTEFEAGPAHTGGMDWKDFRNHSTKTKQQPAGRQTELQYVAVHLPCHIRECVATTLPGALSLVLSRDRLLLATAF